MKKIALLALALVLALGTLGVAYALWWDDLYIEGTVDTGDISAYWTCYCAWDSEIEGKNYSSVTCLVDATDVADDTLNISLIDAYPCIDYYVIADVHNNGSLPIHVCSFGLDRGTLPAGATVELKKVTTLGCPPSTTPVLDDWTGFEQIHPGGVAYVAFHVHLNNDAEEDATPGDQTANYTFSGKLYYQQWNEDCPGSYPPASP